MNKDLHDIINADDLKNSPFKVPDSYFDSLESRLLANAGIEQRKKEKGSWTARIIAMRPVRWAAACACVLALVGTVYLVNTNTNDDMRAQTDNGKTLEYNVDYSAEDAFNQAADYTMLDSHDMYMMLAEE